MKKLLWLLLFSSIGFSEVNISPNMNLPVPIPGVTAGPDWAEDEVACYSAIDSHDHTPGKGVPITSSAININASFPLNNNALTSVKEIDYTSQSSISTAGSMYYVSPDLYFNDGNGNVVRITQNGSVSGSSGTITGLPSGTASASYQSGSGTFVFQSSTNVPANSSWASVRIAPQTASPNGITVKSVSPLSSSYNLTLPASVPGYTSLVSMDTSGTLSTVPYKAPTQQRFTSGSGTYTTPTNPSPLYIKIRMVGGGGGGGAGATTDGGNGTASTFGSSLLTANGGGGGQAVAGGNPGSGGTCTLNSPAYGTSIAGGMGGTGPRTGTGLVPAGFGAPSYFGGSTSTQTGGGGANGVTAPANSGAGGSGANSGVEGAGGGGSGCYIEAMINSPSSSYAYAVGSHGAGGASGGATSGGSGGDGYIEVTEFYQ